MRPLYALPFGQSDPTVHCDVDSIVALRQEHFRGNIALEARGQCDVLAQEYLMPLGADTLMAASSWAPMFARREDFPFVGLVLPHMGTAVFKVGHRDLNLRPGHSGVLLSGSRHEYSGDFCSLSMLALDPGRLARVSDAMLGLEPGSRHVSMRLHEDRELPLVVGAMPFVRVIDAFHMLLASLCGADTQMRYRLCLDDLLYRYCAWLLNPQPFVENWQAAEHKIQPRRSLDALCEYLHAHIAERLTLTDMELFTGLSQRALQYAFFKRYDCSPMQWLREARLGLAHQRLASADPSAGVTQVAMSCGFTNLGNFARYYAQRYGCKPSDTLAISKQRLTQ